MDQAEEAFGLRAHKPVPHGGTANYHGRSARRPCAWEPAGTSNGCSALSVAWGVKNLRIGYVVPITDQSLEAFVLKPKGLIANALVDFGRAKERWWSITLPIQCKTIKDFDAEQWKLLYLYFQKIQTICPFPSDYYFIQKCESQFTMRNVIIL